MEKQNIGILGCGWLGFPLAVFLKNKGFDVKGSVTSTQSLEKLDTAQLKGFEIRLHENGVTGNLIEFLDDLSLLIIAIPPGFRKNPDDSYLQKIQSLWKSIDASNVKNILFISSTSVFGEQQNDITDQTEPLPDALNGQKLREVEIFIQQQKQNSCIFRLGGLFGPNRHPVVYLAGRQNVPQPLGKIHFIHLYDIQEIVLKWLYTKPQQGQFNIVHPERPTRKAYYQNMALKMHLQPPVFDETDTTEGKSIYPDGVLTILQHEFVYSKLEDYPLP